MAPVGHDTTTLAFYAKEATQYAVASERPEPSAPLTRFMHDLKAGARVLDLGCGTGRDTLFMRDAGFVVTPVDGSAEMVRELQKRGGPEGHVMLYENLDWEASFDGVWANASLLHVPRGAIVDVLRRVHHALKPEGHFFASFKAGTEDGRDRFSRYFNYPARTELGKWMTESADWAGYEIEETKGGGYDGEPTDWLYLRARKDING
ncbi:MAG: class I SAM-dependent methyltransferase [Parvibaculum sp.]|nr:class I SAM-dependent methyltransferase [Parvibaculum sp.]|tara:strand:+ start:776 stop:1393 length:618 start_codon:yes stop_codon:yes gene_type:complete